MSSNYSEGVCAIAFALNFISEINNFVSLFAHFTIGANITPHIRSVTCKIIFECMYAGELVKKINDDAFSEGRKHAGLVYVALRDEPTIHVYDPSTLSRIRTLSSVCSCGNLNGHTLRVTSCSIIFACWLNRRIHVLDDSGELQQTHGKHGTAAGEFLCPESFLWLIKTITASRFSMTASGACNRCSRNHSSQLAPSSLHIRYMSLLMT